MATTLTQNDLLAILDFCTALARKAGALILEGSEAIHVNNASQDVSTEKKNSVDLVTEYDVRVEELVRSKTSKQYPAFHL